MANRPKTYGVKKVGNRWTALPYIPGRGAKAYAGTFDTQEEATAAAIMKIEEMRRLPAHLETVKSFADRWVRDFPRPKESTNEKYHAAAQALAKEHGSKKLNEITRQMARTYGRDHKSDVSVLRAFFADALDEDLILDNPFARLGITTGSGRKNIVAITKEELEGLAEVALASDEAFGPTLRSLVLFAAYTGLRPSEIFGLDWSDIDFKAETINVQRQYHKRRLTTPKNGKTRLVYLPPPAAQALRDMPRIARAEHVFAGKEGQRITQPALSIYWKPIRVAFEATLSEGRRAQFRAARTKGSMDFYELRHFCATFLIEEGVELWAIAKQLGHQGTKLIEETYGHPRDEIARQQMRRVFTAPPKLRGLEGGAEEATG
jgi:integrase